MIYKIFSTFTLVFWGFFSRIRTRIFRDRILFLVDPDPDSEKKSDPDPGGKNPEHWILITFIRWAYLVVRHFLWAILGWLVIENIFNSCCCGITTLPILSCGIPCTYFSTFIKLNWYYLPLGFPLNRFIVCSKEIVWIPASVVDLDPKYLSNAD